MKGSHGIKRRTRNFRVTPRDRGKKSIRRYLKTFKDDDIVAVNINPMYQGTPFPRFQGKSGRVVGKQGRAYYVLISDGDKEKKILVTPEHLTSLKYK